MARILLVDDDPDILETVRMGLALHGHEVETARDADGALQAARRAAPELVVLDVMLPGANGYEISRYLKSDMRSGRIPPFKILIVTARRVDSSARQDFLATWSGADATLWKPFDLQALLHRVETLLASRAAGVGG